ncbi:MAG: hypothetical protein AAFQ05_06205 [Pseudomonadota bacterium]
MLTAIQNCIAANQPFAEVFTRQYRLSQDEPPHVDGWARDSCGGWWLTHCPKLVCRPLKDKKGKALGWLLGVAVDGATRAIGPNAYKLKTGLSDADFWDRAEQQISDLSGSYAAILVTPQAPRMYFDPVMNLPGVYHAKSRVVGSSPLMTLSRPMRRNYRINHDRIITEGGNYGMGLTCDPEVMRGMSNHYLDLQSFTLHRHWPHPEDTFVLPDSALDDTAQFLVKRLGKITGALLKAYKCGLPLSGGADSRTLAYSAKTHLKHAALFYAHRTNKITGVDCYIADQLTRDLGFELHLVDARHTLRSGTVSTADVDRLRWAFFQKTGYMRSPLDQELAAKHVTPSVDLVLRGNILDMARANQWPPGLEFSLPHAVSKLRIGGRPMEQNTFYWGAEYCNWLETVPQNAKERLYDFAFLELLLPQTLGARLIAHAHGTYINPFNDRQLIKACMSISPKLRSSRQLNAALHGAAGAPDIAFTHDLKNDPSIGRKIKEMFSALA